MIFRNLVFAAVVVGILSGLIYSAYQQFVVNPIIYAAENFEVIAPEETVDTDESAESNDGHAHSHDAWSPEDGFQRIASTLGSNILIAIGLALLLLCAMVLHNQKSAKPAVNWKSGTLWGLGLMSCFFIAPALLGLHPEVPGTIAENLHQRQVWWITCAIATALGLALLYYARPVVKIFGLILLAAPHVIGAPLPDSLVYVNADPVAIAALNTLTQQFLIMTTVGMFIFFVCLGAFSGIASARMPALPD